MYLKKYMDFDSMRAQGYVSRKREEEFNAELAVLDIEKDALFQGLNAIVDSVREAEKLLYIDALPEEGE